MKTLKLAPCPDCKRMISLTATTCPTCGRTIKEGDLVPVPIDAKPMSKVTIFIIAVVILLIMMMLLNGMEQLKEDERNRERILQMEQRRGRP
jgi:predicted amidophosphoribosyltransferase